MATRLPVHSLDANLRLEEGASKYNNNASSNHSELGRPRPRQPDSPKARKQRKPLPKNYLVCAHLYPYLSALY